MATQPTLRLGDKGSAVTLLQQRLSAHGYTVMADGDFGAKTEAAVEQFQVSRGIDPDGVVGPLTWNLLMSTGTAPTPDDVLEAQRKALLGRIPADAPAAVRSVLESAVRQLGRREIPEGSNGGPELGHIVDEGGDGKAPSAYYLYWKITDPETLKTMPPWCAIFVSWALKAGLGVGGWSEIPFGAWLGGAAQIESWAQKRKVWVAGGATVIPSGAIFTMARADSGSDAAAAAKAGHTGFVVADNRDGTVATIEGNVSNRVGTYNRPKSKLRGWAKWW
jgi:hypothetical protein